MKLYTEEQLKQAIKMALHGFGIGGIEDTIEVVASKLTPIELPSDDEIENYARQSGLVHPFVSRGAKWMRDKIGGNK